MPDLISLKQALSKYGHVKLCEIVNGRLKVRIIGGSVSDVPNSFNILCVIYKHLDNCITGRSKCTVRHGLFCYWVLIVNWDELLQPSWTS